jgi:pSer/pThr/pTyr-binding forkhead associated (FHA) protein
MDDMRQPEEAAGLPVQGPHWMAGPDREPAADFIPLRLILQPSGATVELTRPDMIVGRHSEADIRLPLPDVSRRHCRFLHVEGCWQVIDLNSLNGVFVNGEGVQQVPLHQGDLIRIGGFTFCVDLSREMASEEANNRVESLFPPMPAQLTGSPDQRRAS